MRQSWDFCKDSTVLHRGVPRLDGARGKKQVWRPPCSNLRSFGSECTVLKKNFRHCRDFSAPGAFCPLASHVMPLVWYFATNCATVKFTEPWMSYHFSELRDHSYVSSAVCPECPTKDWRGKSYWPNQRESDPEVVQGPGGVTASPALLGHVLV